MCQPSTQLLIDEVVDDFVAKQIPFTAFTISLAVKKKGGTERHRDMKNDIHKKVSDKIGSDTNWDRTLIDPPGTPPGTQKAFLYYPMGFDPKDFGKDPNDDPNQPISGQFSPPKQVVPPVAASSSSTPTTAPSSVANLPFHQQFGTLYPWANPHGNYSPKPTGPQPTSASASTSGNPKVKVPDGAVAAAPKGGRVCVPKRVLQQLGVTPGDRVYVIMDQPNGKILLSSTPDPNAKDLTVDVRGTVRINPSCLTVAGLKGKNIFDVEFQNGNVTVKAH